MRSLGCVEVFLGLEHFLPVTENIHTHFHQLLTDSHDEDLPAGEGCPHLLVPAGVPGGDVEPGVRGAEDVLYEVRGEGVPVFVLEDTLHALLRLTVASLLSVSNRLSLHPAQVTLRPET